MGLIRTAQILFALGIIAMLAGACTMLPCVSIAENITVQRYRKHGRAPFPDNIPGFQGDELVANHSNRSYTVTNAKVANPHSVTYLNYETNDLKHIRLANRFERLCRLNVRNNDLKSLKISHAYVRWINASTNDITHFSPSNKLPCLEWLNLSNNDIVHLDSYAFYQCPKLRFLNLSTNDIVNLDIAESPILKWLDAHNNDIVTCNNLDTLPSLQFLDLSSNNIRSLPKLHNCRKLQYINLANNDIASVDWLFAVVELPHLHTLDLRNNNLNRMQLSNLRRHLSSTDKPQSVLVL